MFELLLLIIQLCGDARSSSGRHCTPSLVKVAEPHLSHATKRETAAVDDGIWAASEPTITKDGIPPSPAILNAQGWKSVAGLLGFTSGTPVEIDPRNDPTDLSPVAPDIAELLVGWEKESLLKDATLFEFDRFVYDLNQNVETRSSGRLFYQSTDRGRFEIEDASNPNIPSERRDANDQRFTVEEGSAESWTWNPEEILFINHTDKTYSVAPLPRALQGRPQGSQGLIRNILSERVLFIIDVDKNAVRREWSLTLVKRDDSTIFLEAIPRTAARKQQLHKCLIRIDPKSHQVSAIKYVDASQQLETVYVIRKRTQPTVRTIEGGFRPRPQSLQGYRLALTRLW